VPTTVQIELEPDVYERLQALAKPFVDTPSSVIRRLLEESKGTKKQIDTVGIDKPNQLSVNRVYVTSRGVRLPLVCLQATYRRRGDSRTHRFEAEVTPNGIKFDGQVFDDPSPAGIRAKELAGAEGPAANTNGWEFWEYFDEQKRKWISINIFRKKKLVPEISLEDLDLNI
jgi:hypothetical protein